jgi:pantoate--beta-alanine ligase
MQIIKLPQKMQKISLELKRKGKIIGFVPTMGFLHQGHLSLVKVAKKNSDVVVASIFVNPTQFGPKEDFKTYPQDFNRDQKLLQKEGCDIIFLPQVKDIYPPNYLTYVNVEKITDILEGAFRPGHFQGVTTVVAKLFNIVLPDVAVFGQKDAQQAVVIKKMVKDLNFPMKILVAPTARERNGLARSSRNSYLTKEQRKKAGVLYKSLELAKDLIHQGEKNSAVIINKMKKLIGLEKMAKLDYISINDAENLEPVKMLEGEVLISLAAKFGKTRLIDNLKIRVR